MNRVLLLFLAAFYCLQLSSKNLDDSTYVLNASEPKDTLDHKAIYEQEIVILVNNKDRLSVLKDSLKMEQQKAELVNSGVRRILNDKKNQLRSIKGKKEYKEVEKYIDTNDKLRLEIESIQSDITKLSNELKIINDDIKALEADMANLDPIKDSTTHQLLSKYESYLNESLSSLKKDSLDVIVKECENFAVDSRVKAFISRTKELIEIKRAFDDASRVCFSKYDSLDVQNSLKILSTIVAQNQIQDEELKLIMSQLENFHDGVITFKDFIVKLNTFRNRAIEYSSSYSAEDFNDDRRYIMQGLEERIDKYIFAVPYLKREFEKYIEMISIDPMQHPAIEQEIMSL